jgi:hypothetical protein
VFIAEHNQGHHSVYCFSLPSAARFLQDFRVLYHLISGVCVKFSKSCGVLEISIDWTDAKFPTAKFRHNKAVYKREKTNQGFFQTRWPKNSRHLQSRRAGFLFSDFVFSSQIQRLAFTAKNICQ